MLVTFTKYVKFVLPIDGTVFWVKADLLSPGALLGAAKLNGPYLNQAQQVITPAPQLIVEGSLHYATDVQQDETQTFGLTRVLFTTQVKIQDFAQAGPAVLYIASFDNRQFSFGGAGEFFAPAQTFHYYGSAVYSDTSNLLVDAIDGFDAVDQVVSNSMPLWLALNSYVPVYPTPAVNVTLYPSGLSPLNLVPPFATVHIPPELQRALQPTPVIDQYRNHWQLMADRVRITLWGLRNAPALDLLDVINQYSLDTDNFGIMSMTPIVRDDNRTQREMQVKSIKKTLEVEISYYQQRANNVARQLILEAIPTIIIGQQQVRADAVVT